MIIHRIHHARYTVVGNEAIRDTSLSFKATGLLAYLLSLPNDSRVSISRLVSTKTDGFDSVQSGMKELEERKYLRRIRWQKPGGLWDWRCDVTEIPGSFEDAERIEDDDSRDKPCVGFPHTVKPHTVFPSISTKDLSTEKIEVLKELKDVSTEKIVGTVEESVPPSRSKRRVPSPTPEEETWLKNTVAAFRDRLLEVRPNVKAWADDHEWASRTAPRQVAQLWDVVRLDKRSCEDVIEVLKAMMEDYNQNFRGGFHWRLQVLSLGKLRGKVRGTDETIFDRLWAEFVEPKRKVRDEIDDIMDEFSAAAEFSTPANGKGRAAMEVIVRKTRERFPGCTKDEMLNMLLWVCEKYKEKGSRITNLSFLPYVWDEAMKEQEEKNRMLIDGYYDLAITELRKQRREYDEDDRIDLAWWNKRKELIVAGALFSSKIPPLILAAIERRLVSEDETNRRMLR